MSNRTPPAEVFRINLIALMEKTKIKPSELERRSGISRRMIGFLVDGERKPSVETAESIANAFGLTGWQMLLPNLINDMKKSRELNKLIDLFINSSDESQEYILRVAEKEASYKK